CPSRGQTGGRGRREKQATDDREGRRQKPGFIRGESTEHQRRPAITDIRIATARRTGRKRFIAPGRKRLPGATGFTGITDGLFQSDARSRPIVPTVRPNSLTASQALMARARAESA